MDKETSNSSWSLRWEAARDPVGQIPVKALGVLGVPEWGSSVPWLDWPYFYFLRAKFFFFGVCVGGEFRDRVSL